LKRFRAELPGKLDLPESVVRAKSRVAEMDAFVEALDRQSLQGKAL
jgi:hypothetical protein